MSAHRSAPMLGRLPLRDRAEAIARINRFATLGHPFLFLVNYAAERAVVEPLDALAPDALAYDFGGVTNLSPESPQRAVPHASLFGENTPALTPKMPSADDYRRAFGIVQRGLLRGDSFLTNLTQCVPIETPLTLADIFARARARYRLFVPGQWVCFSPEPFVRIADGHIRTFPMKGTLPDGDGAAERLMADAKEAAEHATVVDLLRNDLSRVAEHVRVERYRYVERVITHRGPLLQTSSEIAGRLPADYSAHLGEILFRLLPAGSVTGAPKHATCRLIAEAEGYNRGWYTGIAGWSDGHTLDSAVLIRFVEQTPEGLVFKAGGGITAHSREEREYAEIRDKIYIPF